MFDRAKHWLLDLLRVPAEPEPPAGDAESLLVFRAAPSFYRYKLATWAISQGFAALGVVSMLVLFFAAAAKDDSKATVLLFVLLPAIALLLLVAVLSFVALRLDYEMRWYLVTDQSLRIREGLLFVREMTMTFANIQNIAISQGPLQRLLGVADLEVQSAGGGGGGGGSGDKGQGFQMHKGYFRGVDNAEQLRDLMRERLRRARSSGLGDPEDLPEPEPAAAADDGQLAQVLADLRREAGALRRVAESIT